MFFHELGHYLAARRSGIKVEEFGIWGFPPRLVKLFTYQGTDFTLNAIPLGAFVRMKGEDAADMSPGSFNAASASNRAFTLAAGPAMNFILAILFSIFSVMSGFPTSVSRALVTDVEPNSVAAQIGIVEGDLLLSLESEPLYIGTMDGEQVRAHNGQGSQAPSGLSIIRGEAIQVLPVSPEIDASALLESVEVVPALTTQVTLVVEDTPAEEAGLMPGDVIYQVEGIPVTLESPLSDLVSAQADSMVQLTLLRGDELIEKEVFARANPPAGQGAMGIAIDGVPLLVTLPLPQAIWRGITGIVDYVGLVLSLPVMLIMGQIAPSDAGFAGPVGIAQMVGGAVNATADTGLWFPIWQLAAVISAGLAIANLLPIPALDGGRLLFILVEKLRGRRIDPEKEGIIHLVGFALLLGLMVVITISDIRSGPQGIDWNRLLGQ